MSSTNKTANLGLNQWVRTDPFCMDDFNEDNAKLDTAIKSASTRDKLFDITVGTQSANIDIDFSQIDLEQYYELIILANYLPSASSKYMRINGKTSGYRHQGPSATLSADNMVIQNGIAKMSLYGIKYMYTCDEKFERYSITKTTAGGKLDTLNFVADPTNGYYYEPGTEIIIYGVKK